MSCIILFIIIKKLTLLRIETKKSKSKYFKRTTIQDEVTKVLYHVENCHTNLYQGDNSSEGKRWGDNSHEKIWSDNSPYGKK